jgi:hypothetical protein
MSLKTRIRRLEQRTAPDSSCVQALILDLPDSPPLMSVAGRWLTCDNPVAVLARPSPLKVYDGFDPRVALGCDNRMACRVLQRPGATVAGTALLVQQMRDFAVGDHDDGPDALEMALRLMIDIYNGRHQPLQPNRSMAVELERRFSRPRTVVD